MALQLRREFAVAAFPMEQSAKSRKPSSQLPHNHAFPWVTRAAGLKTGHYKIILAQGDHGSTRVARRAGGSMLPVRRTKGTQLPLQMSVDRWPGRQNSNPDSVRDNASATTEADSHAEKGKTSAFAQNRLQDVRSMRSQSYADSNFMRTPPTE